MSGSWVQSSGEADALMARALEEADPEALTILRDHLPKPILDGLIRVLSGESGPDLAGQLGQTLAEASMPASAVAAYRCQADMLPMGRERMKPWQAITALVSRQGLTAAVSAHERLLRRLSGEGGQEAPPAMLSTGDWTILPCTAELGLTGSLAQDPLRDPGLGRKLWRAASPLDTDDLSFLLIDRCGVPVLRVECDVRGDRDLGCREVGIVLTVLIADHPDLAKAERLAVTRLRELAAWAGCSHLWLDLPADGPWPDPIAELADRLGPRSRVSYRNGWIDLTGDEQALRASYRATTRQRIRWGEAAMTLRHSSEVGMDVAALQEEVARVLRRPPSLPPEFLQGAVASGEIAATAAFLGDKLACLVLVSRHGTASYDLSTARLVSGKEPVSHAVIHAAILGELRRGARRFHFGPLYEGGEFGAKQRGIAIFKAGFASGFESRTMLRLSA